jgi:hypothetical protein
MRTNTSKFNLLGRPRSGLVQCTGSVAWNGSQPSVTERSESLWAVRQIQYTYWMVKEAVVFKPLR